MHLTAPIYALQNIMRAYERIATEQLMYLIELTQAFTFCDT